MERGPQCDLYMPSWNRPRTPVTPFSPDGSNTTAWQVSVFDFILKSSHSLPTFVPALSLLCTQSGQNRAGVGQKVPLSPQQV